MDSTKGVNKIKANNELLKELKSEDNITNAIINKKVSEIRQISKRLMLEDIKPTIFALKTAPSTQVRKIIEDDLILGFFNYLIGELDFNKLQSERFIQNFCNHLSNPLSEVTSEKVRKIVSRKKSRQVT